MAKIAVMGYGTVGSGIVEVLRENAALIEKRVGEPVEVKYILDIRKFPGDPMEHAVTDDFEKILSDPEVTVVAEAMGGLKPAYDFTKRALLAGKSVCTSNKELVAEHGIELCRIAKENGVHYYFEASCGGGIPVIRPLRNAVTADKILLLMGIFNGTTNYILTKMATDGAEYEDVLRKAQEMGYAERNPAADVEGMDACRKLAILASLAYGEGISYRDIRTEGITKISAADMKYAALLNYKIKLLGISRRAGDGLYAVVEPAMIGADTPLYAVDDVFNAILVRGNMLGDVMFYGKGAGKLPTGSAVVSDILEAVAGPAGCDASLDGDKAVILPPEEMTCRFFFRVKAAPEREEAVNAVFPDAAILSVPSLPEEFGVVTGIMTEKAFAEKTAELEGLIHFIRILTD